MRARQWKPPVRISEHFRFHCAGHDRGRRPCNPHRRTSVSVSVPRRPNPTAVTVVVVVDNENSAPPPPPSVCPARDESSRSTRDVRSPSGGRSNGRGPRPRRRKIIIISVDDVIITSVVVIIIGVYYYYQIIVVLSSCGPATCLAEAIPSFQLIYHSMAILKRFH